MEINQRLNLVFPVDQAGGTSQVHAMPISHATFERYFLPIAKTFTALHAEGLGVIGGPRVASMMLKKVAEEMNAWDGPTGVERGLVTEIRRLMNVITPAGDVIPMQEAVDKSYFSKEDQAEVENAATFFTVSSRMHLRTQLEAILDGLCALWGGQTTSLSATEFAASSRTSTATESTGATQNISSVAF